MRAGEIAQHRVAEQASSGAVLFNQPVGRVALETHHDCVVHRFGAVQAFSSAIETKAIAAEAKLGNMASAIGEKFADANRAGDDLVPAIRAVAFGN